MKRLLNILISPQLRFGSAAVVFLAIIGASMFRSFGWYLDDIYWFEYGLGGDKVAHFLMGSIFMILGFWVLLPRNYKEVTRIFLAVLAFLAIEEALQTFSPTRVTNIGDFAIGAFGATFIYSFWLTCEVWAKEKRLD